MHFLPEPPGRFGRCRRDGGACCWRARNRFADKTRDQVRFQAELLGIGNVLPAAAAASAAGLVPEMEAAGRHSMARWLENLVHDAHQRPVARTMERRTNTFAGDGERNGDGNARDTIAIHIQVIDGKYAAT